MKGEIKVKKFKRNVVMTLAIVLAVLALAKYSNQATVNQVKNNIILASEGDEYIGPMPFIIAWPKNI